MIPELVAGTEEVCMIVENISHLPFDHSRHMQYCLLTDSAIEMESLLFKREMCRMGSTGSRVDPVPISAYGSRSEFHG